MQEYIECKNENTILRGTLHIPDNVQGKIPVAILFHGFTADRNENRFFMFVDLSRELEKRQIASVRFDFAGSGESDGEFCDMSVSSEIADRNAILNLLLSLDFINTEYIYCWNEYGRSCC
ncbi:Alpha/beta superfamily hydrolase [Thermoanaerobacterium thermosaccharolyticum]|uniref:Alpha/beta superfamily hydrolase n=1 Tax=Thermoanaerobacterium thermosaccharolyticum TaxID=1517 RepID=A0A223HZC4_THETR|nr:hypothetical protein [Thermoanaerobacterium thermosaccharolyticum]AST57737.1 Alpha/beta superfamily hydrolase [Thermoanaerobacterium thermosaccharolyticum]